MRILTNIIFNNKLLRNISSFIQFLFKISIKIFTFLPENYYLIKIINLNFKLY